MDNRLKLIADYYGYESQREQLIEECAEIVLAVQKCKRYGTKEHLESFEGEVADVLIMAMQMKYMLGDTKINQVIDEKLTRQMHRIEDIEGFDIWERLRKRHEEQR